MSWICAWQGVTIATRLINAQYLEPLGVIHLSVLGWQTTAALREASVNLRTQQLHTPQPRQQGASLTQARISVTCEENMHIPNQDVWHLDQSVVRGRCATTTAWQMALWHVVRTMQRQRWVRVCRAQRLTDVSPLVLLIAQRRTIVCSWELKVAAMLRAGGTRVIANLLHLSCRWCDFRTGIDACFCGEVAWFGKSCVSTRL